VPKFNLKKKVPDVYSYLFNRNELKGLSESIPEISTFWYDGISPHDQIKDGGLEFWLGHLNGKKEDGEWSFSLHLYANRIASIRVVEEIAKQVANSSSRSWIGAQTSQPESYPDGFNTLYISIKLGSKGYISSSSEHTKTKWRQP